jgi:general secretion pathway protein A
MYRKYFGLTHFPFNLEFECEGLFVCATITEAEARLKHLLELRAIGLITGEVGSGKTTICRKVASALHSGLYRVFYLPLFTGNLYRGSVCPH